MAFTMARDDAFATIRTVRRYQRAAALLLAAVADFRTLRREWLTTRGAPGILPALTDAVRTVIDSAKLVEGELADLLYIVYDLDKGHSDEVYAFLRRLSGLQCHVFRPFEWTCITNHVDAAPAVANGIVEDPDYLLALDELAAWSAGK